MLKNKLELLQKEFTTLKQKITTKLATQQQTITETNNKLQESNRKLETALKENTENEQVLEQLLKEFQDKLAITPTGQAVTDAEDYQFALGQILASLGAKSIAPIITIEETITEELQTQLTNLQAQIASKETEIINKRVRVDELRAQNTNLSDYDIQEESNDPIVSEFSQLEKEIATLHQEVSSLNRELAEKEEELAIKYPDEQSYLTQLKVQGEKYISLEKKLEQIRDLIADQQLNKLMALYKKGEI
ncbi:7372_t:CDS:2 [Entrophospora sp. SA101]|nr:7973_t:CDS:2 [Entrophospora sp. SA101]CAJ0830441.1 7079_t:CDS:2 [Entrophospora sp. SA101]CAJ0888645.1 7372_t:CDS:2 [Entrophospora sp. SA101]